MRRLVVPVAVVLALALFLGVGLREDDPPDVLRQVTASRCLYDLDEAGSERWPVYVDPPGQPVAKVAAVETVPVLGGADRALRISLLPGARPYTGAHAYYTHQLPEGAEAFSLSFDYLLPPTSLNNFKEPSLVQAVEVSLSFWEQSAQAGVFYRYEWALQYQIVADDVPDQTAGEDAPAWRLWGGEQQWLSTGIAQELVAGDEKWHTIVLEGYLTGSRNGDGTGRVHYVAMRSDDLAIPLDVEYPPVVAESEATENYVTAAIQLDGNYQQDPYSVIVDNVVLCPFESNPWGG